jgi:hypothetical protein
MCLKTAAIRAVPQHAPIAISTHNLTDACVLEPMFLQ